MLNSSDVTGLILAGGEGRRMDNRDKGLVTLVNKPLVDYALSCLTSLTVTNFISCNRNQESYRQFHCQLVADDVRWPSAGPMAGVYAALKQCQTDWLLVSPCDTPLMQQTIMQRLLMVNDDAVRVHILAYDGWQPLHALYHKSLLPLLEKQLESKKTGLQFFLRQLPKEQLQVSDISHGELAFKNTNDQSELDQVSSYLIQTAQDKKN